MSKEKENEEITRLKAQLKRSDVRAKNLSEELEVLSNEKQDLTGNLELQSREMGGRIDSLKDQLQKAKNNKRSGDGVTEEGHEPPKKRSKKNTEV